MGSYSISNSSWTPDEKKRFSRTPVRPTAQIDRFNSRKGSSVPIHPDYSDKEETGPKYLTKESGIGWKSRAVLNKQIGADYRQQMTEDGATSRAMNRDETTLKNTALAGLNTLENTRLNGANTLDNTALAGLNTLENTTLRGNLDSEKAVLDDRLTRGRLKEADVRGLGIDAVKSGLSGPEVEGLVNQNGSQFVSGLRSVKFPQRRADQYSFEKIDKYADDGKGLGPVKVGQRLVRTNRATGEISEPEITGSLGGLKDVGKGPDVNSSPYSSDDVDMARITLGPDFDPANASEKNKAYLAELNKSNPDLFRYIMSQHRPGNVVQ